MTLRFFAQAMTLATLVGVLLVVTGAGLLYDSRPSYEVSTGRPNTTCDEDAGIYFDESNGAVLSCRSAGAARFTSTSTVDGAYYPGFDVGAATSVAALARGLGADGIFSENDRDQVQRYVDEVASRVPPESIRERTAGSGGPARAWTFVLTGGVIVVLAASAATWAFGRLRARPPGAIGSGPRARARED